MIEQNTRREFIKRGSLAATGLMIPNHIGDLPFSILNGQPPASDQINVGVIGCNGMGWSDLQSHLKMPEVNCVALADIDQRVLDKRCANVKELRGTAPKQYKDYRKLLENKDIDFVIIATPDHWHCLTAINALDAGKDVYVEKPLANSIEECNLMARAADKYNKLVQVGQWQRSGQHYTDAINYVQSGRLGKIRLVKCWAYQGWMNPIPVKPDTKAPEGVDYTMWLGPALKRPFNENRFHFNFRWFWDYAGGLMTDWGVHEIDIALYAMGATAPKSIMASGGKFAYPNDASETPDTLQTVFEFDNFNLLWEHATGIDGGNYGRTEGIAFIGNNGTLVLNRQGWEVIPESEEKDGKRVTKLEKVALQKANDNALDNHTVNFISSLKANDASMLNCDIKAGNIAAHTAHMGNIAFKMGEKLYWDKGHNTFSNKGANDLLKASYHNDWNLPKIP